MSTRPNYLQRPRGVALIGATLVGVALAACSPGTSADPAASGAPSSACTTKVDKKDVKLVLGVGSLSSAYWQEVIKGAQAVADSAGVPLQTYESKFDGQTMLNTLSSKLAGGGQGTAIVVDPASNAFTKPIVQVAQQAGAHIVTLWNRPTDAHPWDFGGGCWIAHTAFDGGDSGKENSKALFGAVGGSGGIVALQGVPDDPPNKQRMFGLQQALKQNTSVKLLDLQTANWAAATAQNAVQALLAKYPGQVKGVFAANDDMAVGTVEALRAKGLAGKVAVTGSDGSTDMLALIASGDATSTMRIDSYAQGAYGAAIAIASEVGDIDPATLSHAQRDFYIKQELVDKTNVQQVAASIKDFKATDYTYDKLKANLWERSAGAIDDTNWIPTVSLP